MNTSPARLPEDPGRIDEPPERQAAWSIRKANEWRASADLPPLDDAAVAAIRKRYADQGGQ